MDNAVQLIFFFLVIIPSAVVHEYAHGWVADRLGDPTPRLAGRLTINPIAHIDPWGTLLMPFMLFWLTGGRFLFAAAKPVPINPYALRGGRWGSAVVGLAGPAANLIIAFGLGLFVRVAPATAFTALLAVVVYANIILAVFNLVPIPPLDGSRLLLAFVSDKYLRFKMWFERYGLILVLIFAFYFFTWLIPVVEALFSLAVGNFSFGT